MRVTISSNAPEAAAVGAAALVLQSELAPRQAGLRMPLECLSRSPPAPERPSGQPASRSSPAIGIGSHVGRLRDS